MKTTKNLYVRPESVGILFEASLPLLDGSMTETSQNEQFSIEDWNGSDGWTNN